MLKFIFWLLLSINAALFAYGRGYLGNFKEHAREPARLKNQLNADKLKLLTMLTNADGTSALAAPKALLVSTAAPAALATVASAPEAPVAAPAAPAALVAAPPVAAADPKLVACTLVGNFAALDARRFETQVGALQLGPRQSRENVAVQEISSYMVFIAPQGSKEAAERKAEELKSLGISNYFIMNDSAPLKWAISLGVFKSETAAQTLLAALNKQGLSSAKIVGRATQATRLAYRFRDLDAATKTRLDAITARFPQQDARTCK